MPELEAIFTSYRYELILSTNTEFLQPSESLISGTSFSKCSLQINSHSHTLRQKLTQLSHILKLTEMGSR